MLASPKIICCLVALLFFNAVAAQLEVASGPPYTPQNLIETVFLGSGVELVDIVYTGNAQATGFFEGGNNAIGLDRGIVLSTGRVKGTFNQVDVENVGADFASTDFMNPPVTDPDLALYLDDPTLGLDDIVSYTIRFRPFGDSIRFRYVFASEEYPEFVCSAFNDIFGFFISGPGINGPFSNNGENLAVIPGTNLPVRINTVNGGQAAGDAPCDLSNSQFYVDNNDSDLQPVFDGLTTVFIAEAAVIPCEEYTIKIILADVGDGLFDSGVFLEARSFEASGLQLSFTGLSLDNSMAEGCRDATITFTQPEALQEVQPISFRIFGDASPGLDYTAIPNPLIVPSGEREISYTIQAFEDNLAEGDEFIYIEVRQSPCSLDTFTIRIRDNILVPGFLPDSLLVCPGDTVALDANLPVMTPAAPTFTNSTPLTIGPNISSQSSFIDVSGVAPTILQAGVIQSVCIDSLTHQWLDDVDIYLIGPNGQILSLTTDNGGDGGNLSLEDAYIRTCFTPTALDSIAPPGGVSGPENIPFTGEWQPEGAWQNLYGDFFTTNGRWELRVFDDANGFGGTLWSWRITFEPIYSIDYSWSPDTSLSCYDCPTPLYLGEEVGYFYVNATDVYGCMLQDSVFASYRPTPTLDNVRCEMATDSSLTIGWEAVVDALGYEVRLDERNWLAVGNATSFTFENLRPDSTYSIYVRALFNNCPSPQFNIFCRTTPCIPPQLSATNLIDPSCSDDANGQITIAATGRRAPFSFTLNNEALLAGTITGLAAGNYLLAVEDTLGCRDSLDFIMVAPAPIAAAISLEAAVSCTDAQDARLVALVAGGTATYTYLWNGNPGDSLLSNVGAGSYILHITDANGCRASDTLVVENPASLRIDQLSSSPNGCAAQASGSLQIAVNGGSGAYTYNWSEPNLGNTPNPSQLQAGNYSVTVSDANNCQDSASMLVEQEFIELASLQTTNNNCASESLGMATLVVNQAQGLLAYQLSTPSGNLAATVSGSQLTFNNLASGAYQLTVTDARACQDSLLFIIAEPPPIRGTASIEPINCLSPTASILWNGGGGSGDLSFNWSNGSNSASISGLLAGQYNLSITDAAGCSLQQSFLIDTYNFPSIQTLIQPVSCAEAVDGAIYPTFTNVQPPVNYAWLSADGVEVGRDAALTQVAAGTYRLVGQDAQGCPLDELFILTAPEPLNLAITLEDIRCAGESNGLLELTASGGTPGYRYRIQGQSEWQTNNLLIGLAAGSYRIELSDQQDCRLLSSPVFITEPLPLELSLGDPLTVTFGDSQQLFPRISGGGGNILAYRWLPQDSSLFSCLDCPIPFISPIDQASIRLQITDSRGCLAEDELAVFVRKDFTLLVPTGFSPNGDGQNDRLIVHGSFGMQVLQFQVFDRWGELVYEKLNFPVNEDTESWDGLFRNESAPAGTYLWQARALLPDGSEQNYRGQTTLIR